MNFWTLWTIISFIYSFLQFANAQENCSAITSCESCSTTTDCSWCTSEGCLATSNFDQQCGSKNSYYDGSSCKSNQGTIILIFVIVLAALVCLCCGTCYWRKYHDGEEGNLVPLLNNSTRSSIWRNSLQESGENEWMCIICGFDNKPRNKHCIMCGTQQEFTIEYKSDKAAEKKKRKEWRLKGKQTKEVDFNNASIIISESTNELTKDEPHSSVFFRANMTNSTKLSLSAAQRREAFNYRRLNQLTLRQKSARRRRMWRREFDAVTQQLKWVRTPVSATTVGNNRFGYSPNNSICRQSFSSFSSASNFNTQALLAAAKGEKLPPASSTGKSKRGSFDSFGDNTLISTSPGYTSHFDEEGGLQWEKIVPGKAAARTVGGSAILTSAVMPPHPPPQSTGEAGRLPGDEGEEGPPREPLEQDLETVAAYAFREKQFWFLEQMALVQQPWSEGCVIIELMRDKILEHSHNAIMSIDGINLHKWIRIQFIGEVGIDAGGLEREWFSLLIKALMAPQAGLFVCSAADGAAGTYSINPLSSAFNRHHLSYFRFAGRIFGKALMEQQAIAAPLALPLRKQILALPITFSDLEFVDVELHRNLEWMRASRGVDALDLCFSVTYESMGKTVTHDLKPGGKDIAVTDENKQEYLDLRLRHRMFESIKPQLEHLLRGIFEVVPPELISVFDYQELELLMCGVPEIDVADWARHTEYWGVYNKEGGRQKVIRWFWLAVEAMSTEERVRLLQFVTGCSRLPAQGFKALQSNDGNFRKFNIQSITKQDSLYPRAHTCFNKLDLPVYDSQAELDAYLSVVTNMEVTGFSME